MKTQISSALIVALLAIFTLFAGNSSVIAQTSRGTVSGTITDPNGAVVMGAMVDVVNKSTNQKRSTTSNDSGNYRIDAVDPGVYDVIVTTKGFKTRTTKGVQVSANLMSTLDARLEIGAESVVVEVTTGSGEALQTSEPVRGGNFSGRRLENMPAGASPYDLARLLPGVVTATGGAQFGNDSQFSINGSRPRANNYLIDGTENNDISVTGPATTINNNDAVSEVSVQTGLFSAEFGRAGGGVFNIITKSGTNGYHGSIRWLHWNQRFNSYSNTDGLLGRTRKNVFDENIYGGTIGGPLPLPNFGEGGPYLKNGKDRTFFFFALQWDRRHASSSVSFRVPSQNGVNTLRALFPVGTNPRVDTYLQAIGSGRGTASFQTIDLGTGPNGAGVVGPRGLVETGLALYPLPLAPVDRQWVLRIDHRINDKQQLAFRYTDDIAIGSTSMSAPGMTYENVGPSRNFLITHTWIMKSNLTNELRVSPYGLIFYDFPISANQSSLVNTLPAITFQSTVLDRVGMATNIPQGRKANNYLVQDTMTWVTGNHTFRYGAEFLKQTAFQRQPFNKRGSFTFNTGGGYSALANFIDNFSGAAGLAAKNIGEPGYNPSLFRQSYFVQDTWKTTQNLTLTLGVRYENFGQPANNAFVYPAFAGFDPALFLVPNKVKRDNNNFGPIVGFAWSPSFTSGIGGAIFGDKKSSIRGGYQVSYDTFFNNMLSNIAADSPNRPSVSFAGASGRGTANWFPDALNQTFTPGPLNSQTSVFNPNIRNPYTQRYSLGWQRELPHGFFMDVAYVGTLGRKLFVTETLNTLAVASRRFPLLGTRRYRTSGANSNYDAAQFRLDKRLTKGLTFTASYTWSKLIDQVSEIFATDTSVSSLAVIPAYLGGLKLDRGLSDYDRRHRLAISYVWNVPGPKEGVLGQILGGWQIAGITTFQSGAPFSLANGFDRNGDGDANDRPNVGNPNAPHNTRALFDTRTTGACSTGYYNPDTATTANPFPCVATTDVYAYQVQSGISPAMIGRNTEHSNWGKNTDMSFLKMFRIREGLQLQYRLDTYNTFNHPQYTGVPGRSMTSAVGSYFNYLLLGAGGRTLRMGLKIIF